MIKRTRSAYGYRVRRVRNNASNFEGLAFPKGMSKADKKAAEHADLVAYIKAIREALFARTNVCACCGDTEALSIRKHGLPHQMHEDPPRSTTRGLPKEERFNLRVCMRICADCHNKYTHHKIWCVALSDLGWAGDYDVRRKREGYGNGWECIRIVRV